MATSPGVIQGHANLGNSTSQAIDPISYDTDEADFQEGGFDPAADGLPSYTGSLQAPIKAGAEWYATVAGVLSGTPGITGGDEFAVGDTLLALVDNPGSTATNWLRKGTGDSALAAGGGWAEEAAAKTAAEEGSIAATFGVGATVAGAPSVRLTDSLTTTALARLVDVSESAGIHRLSFVSDVGSAQTFRVIFMDRVSDSSGTPASSLYKEWVCYLNAGTVTENTGTTRGTALRGESTSVASDTSSGDSWLWEFEIQAPTATAGHRWAIKPVTAATESQSNDNAATGSLDIANLEARYLGPTGGWPNFGLLALSLNDGACAVTAGDPLAGAAPVKLTDSGASSSRALLWQSAIDADYCAGIYEFSFRYKSDAADPFHALAFQSQGLTTTSTPDSNDHMVLIHNDSNSHGPNHTGSSVGETLLLTSTSSGNGWRQVRGKAQLPSPSSVAWNLWAYPAFCENTETITASPARDAATTGSWEIADLEVRKTGQPFMVSVLETTSVQKTGSATYGLTINDTENDPLGYWDGNSLDVDFDGSVDLSVLVSYANNAAAGSDNALWQAISTGAGTSVVVEDDIESLGIGVRKSAVLVGNIAVVSGDSISIQLASATAASDIQIYRMQASFTCHSH